MIKKFLYPICFLLGFSANAAATNKQVEGQEQRQFMIESMLKIADPVLSALRENQLKAKMPVECAAGQESSRREVTYLEAFGRLIGGMAPWLELGADQTPEGKLREKYIVLVRQCIHNATDPMHFTRRGR